MLFVIAAIPTIYELLGVDPPDVLNGWTQNPIEGQSFAASFTDPQAAGRATQFYSMLGMRALYHTLGRSARCSDRPIP